MKNLTEKFLTSPALIFAALLGISVFSLSAALIGQFAFDLPPCELCLYQRYPFIAVIVLAGIGLAMRRNLKVSAVLIAASGVAFLINAAIAAYHSGIERHWWSRGEQGCAVPVDTGDSAWIDKILSSPSVPCDVIAWADPILGLTMANLNVGLGIFMAAFCAAAFYKIMPRPAR